MPLPLIELIMQSFSIDNKPYNILMHVNPTSPVRAAMHQIPPAVEIIPLNGGEQTQLQLTHVTIIANDSKRERT